MPTEVKKSKQGVLEGTQNFSPEAGLEAQPCGSP